MAAVTGATRERVVAARSEVVFRVDDLRVRAGVDSVCSGASERSSSRRPGRIRSGSAPTVSRLAAYNRCQPPWTWWVSAMPESVSPRTTVYISAVPACDWGVVCGFTSRTERLTVRVAVSGVPRPEVEPAAPLERGWA
ncbi:hypothetical protein GCM10022206_78290 [Streptomyces chiangmaiensis]